MRDRESKPSIISRGSINCTTIMHAEKGLRKFEPSSSETPVHLISQVLHFWSPPMQNFLKVVKDDHMIRYQCACNDGDRRAEMLSLASSTSLQDSRHIHINSHKKSDVNVGRFFPWSFPIRLDCRRRSYCIRDFSQNFLPDINIIIDHKTNIWIGSVIFLDSSLHRQTDSMQGVRSCQPAYLKTVDNPDTPISMIRLVN